jgi:hypothetical protein
MDGTRCTCYLEQDDAAADFYLFRVGSRTDSCRDWHEERREDTYWPNVCVSSVRKGKLFGCLARVWVLIK